MEVVEEPENNAVKIIRDGMRELVHAERKGNRWKALNKNRVALGNIVSNSSFTPEFVMEKTKALKKKALLVEDYKQLQNALLQSEENVNSFLRVDHILFSLVRDISCNDPALQLCAIGCSCNIALGNSKACTSLTKSIGPYLVTELDTLNYPLLEACIWTMGNLVGGSDKALEILHAQGSFRYITSLMENCDNIIMPSVAYAAMHYVRNGFKHIQDDEIIEFTNATTKRNLSFDSAYFVWLLALLSSKVYCIPYMCNVVPSIIDYLYQNTRNKLTAVTEVTITACLRILANTVHEKSGRMAKFLLENPKYTQTDTEILLNVLLSCQYIHIRKETLWLIGNLYNHNSADIKRLIKYIMSKLSSVTQAILSLTQDMSTVSFNREFNQSNNNIANHNIEIISSIMIRSIE